MNTSEGLLRLPQVIQLTGISRAQIYRKVKTGEFPRQHRISERTSAWRADEVKAWIDSVTRVA